MNLAVIAAIVLAEGTGLTIFDPTFAIGIAAFLITSAARIARHSLDMLTDRELPAHQPRRIRDIFITHPEPRRVLDMHTRHAGDRHLIELHTALDRPLTPEEAHDLPNQGGLGVMAATHKT